jgi:proliferating cell nuclear antigen
MEPYLVARMFSAIVRADTLQATLDSVGVLVEECKIHLDEGGIEIRAVDPANVGMVDLSLEADAFESYEADGGLIGVNLVRLADIAGMADSDQLVHLELDEETRKLHISIDGLEYTLALIDPESIREEPDLPDLDLPANIVIEGRDIDRAVTAADMVSDHIELGVDEGTETFYVSAEGDTDDVHLELDAGDLIDLVSGPASSLFSLDYLDDMNRAIPKDAEVTTELGEEFPVKLHFDIAEGEGSVTYMLAPRIQRTDRRTVRPSGVGFAGVSGPLTGHFVPRSRKPRRSLLAGRCAPRSLVEGSLRSPPHRSRLAALVAGRSSSSLRPSAVSQSRRVRVRTPPAPTAVQ